MKVTGRACILSCTVTGLTAGLFLSAASNAGPDKAEVKKSPSVGMLKLPGRVEPGAQAPLYSRIVGYVSRVNVALGDRVKKGQIVAVLQVPEFEAELHQKEAQVAQAEAELEHAQQVFQEATKTLTLAGAQVQEAEQAIKQAQAKADAAEAEYKQARKGFKEKSVTAQMVEEKSRLLDTARAEVEEAAAKAQVARSAREGVAANRASAEAGVKVAAAHREVVRAEARRAQDMLSYAQIRAPFAGVITRRAVEVGLLVGPPGYRGRPLFTLTAVDTLRFVVDVPEVDAVSRLRVGTEAEVNVKGLPGHRFAGKVTRLAGAVDPARGTLRAEIDLANADGRLMPGMSGTVSLSLGGNKGRY
jgi:multidrug efflux pump subunit AcrA (membrane-fusion protein)